LRSVFAQRFCGVTGGFSLGGLNGLVGASARSRSRKARETRGACEARKAQVAVELFLGMTLFLLVLYWMNYFTASVRDSNTALVDEERFAAASLVQAANSVCAADTSITLALPCLYAEGESVDYSVNANGADNVLWIIPKRGGAPWISKRALCNFSGVSVKAECGVSSHAGERSAGSVCVNLSSGVSDSAVGIWEGACLQ
jgi:hypothetical protein